VERLQNGILASRARWVVWRCCDRFRETTGSSIGAARTSAPDWYYKEIDAFHRAKKFNARGEQYEEWEAHGPDHGADGECIGVIAASMADLAGAESLVPAS